MIILDFNQVCISNLMSQIGNYTNTKIEEGMLRHMILNTIRSLNVKFKDEYGDLVIARDGANSWRRQVFPYYKAQRRKFREESELDWKELFEIFGKISAEIKEFFPYPLIEVEGCEADDVIATLVFEYTEIYPTSMKILILSGDKDFIQLQVRPGVKQFDPVRKKWITHNNPEKYLIEHILRGDPGDGIPNVLSSDDTFITKTRQTPLTQKKIELYLSGKTSHISERNFARNKLLIDLKNVPNDLRHNILNEFEMQKGKTRNNLFHYFIKNRLSNLMEHIGDF